MTYRKFCLLVAVITCCVLVVGVLVIAKMPTRYMNKAEPIVWALLAAVMVIGLIEMYVTEPKDIKNVKFSMYLCWFATMLLLSLKLKEPTKLLESTKFEIMFILWFLGFTLVMTRQYIRGIRAKAEPEERERARKDEKNK